VSKNLNKCSMSDCTNEIGPDSLEFTHRGKPAGGICDRCIASANLSVATRFASLTAVDDSASERRPCKRPQPTAGRRATPPGRDPAVGRSANRENLSDQANHTPLQHDPMRDWALPAT
jgi:hypothetical protein